VNTHDGGPEGDRVAASGHALDTLREEHAWFRIWPGDNVGRVRHVARSQCTGLSPHTVVTADLAELRFAHPGDLEQPPAAGGVAFDSGKPGIARVHDRRLGGKDSFATDRVVANALTAEFPEIAQETKANRQFVARAVRHVAAQGIRQYVDVSTGLPASPAVHQIAGKAQPAARVAYVDHNPVVFYPNPPGTPRSCTEEGCFVREPDDPGAEYPGKLSVQLATRGVQCELITTGYAPRLRLEIPWLGGWDSAAFEDNVLAAQSQDGQWRFWWPWIRPIGFADDAANVAEYLAGTMIRAPDIAAW
jgi:hypothetical protein